MKRFQLVGDDVPPTPKIRWVRIEQACAAIEAVLEMRPITNPCRTLDEWEEGYNEALDQVKHKIRTALGEEQ